MQTIILAGGLGTRVKNLTKNKIPKPMLIVNGRPFLEHLLEWLLLQRVEEVVIAIGFRGEVIRDYFKDDYKGIKIVYSSEQEDELLGTGGAIKKASSFCNKERIIVVNGDTFFPIDLNQLFSFHMSKNSEITIALKKMSDFDRFGVIELDHDQRIIRFKEKGYKKEGLINGGVYCIKKEVLSDWNSERFYFEKDLLQPHVGDIKMFGILFDENFYDIGTPIDFKRYAEAMNP